MESTLVNLVNLWSIKPKIKYLFHVESMFSWFITMFSWFITIYFMPRVESYVKVAAKNTWDSRKSKSVLQNLIKLKWIYILRAKVH